MQLIAKKGFISKYSHNSIYYILIWTVNGMAQ